jgi:hypothetical protein
MEATIWDRFEAYRLQLAVGPLSIPDEFWPKEGPERIRTHKFAQRVVARTDLAVTGLS